ncbi:hypothetical protein M9458_019308, partial [Cirrhinus mrigala]
KLWKSGEIPPEQHVASSESPNHHSPPLSAAWDFAHSQRMNTQQPAEHDYPVISDKLPLVLINELCEPSTTTTSSQHNC